MVQKENVARMSVAPVEMGGMQQQYVQNHANRV
jgi:hypothetical protein